MTRHGQSLWQVNGEAAGPDAPLSPLGELQAHCLGEYLWRYEHIDRIVTSDLQRAQRTAEIVASYLGLALEVDPNLREYARWAEGWAPRPKLAWDMSPATPLSPAYAAFREHMWQVLRHLAEPVAGEQTVLCVAHGGTIGVLLRILIGSDTPRLWSANTALHCVEWREYAWMLQFINQLEHLPRAMRSW